MAQLLTVRQHAAGNDRLDTHYVRLQAATGVHSLISQVAMTGPPQAQVADGIRTDGDPLQSGAQPTGSWTFRVPLLDSITEAQPAVSVTIDLRHVDFSQNTNPRAIHVSSPAAGYSSTSAPDIRAPMLRWEPNAKQLSFDPLPITFVTKDSGNFASPASLADPLLGGQIEIDPFILLGMEDEFLAFAGDSFRVRDVNGNLLLVGRAPTLAYDTSGRMQEGFDFFLPVLALVQNDLGDSAWLRDFLTHSSFFDSYIPGLHLAAPSLSAVDWQRPFVVPVSGQLAVSGGRSPDSLASDRPTEAPAPATLSLMLLVWLALLPFRRHR
jgi:hypothetical protein